MNGDDVLNVPAVLAQANAEDLFTVIAFVFAALWFVLKVATDRMRNPNRGPGRPGAPPARPDQRQRPPLPPGQRDPREEVAEFLRRAQLKRAEPPRPVANPRKASPNQQQQPQRKRDKKGGSRRIATGAPAPPPPRPVTKPVEQPDVVRPIASPLTGTAAGGSVSDTMLTGTTTTSPETTDAIAPAIGFLDLLGDRIRVRDAIILGEILDRPTQRWE